MVGHEGGSDETAKYALAGAVGGVFLAGLAFIVAGRGRRHAIVFLALGAAALLTAPAHAATIDVDNAQDLQYIIVYSNATITISANETGIVISNKDNATALVVFNPLFGYVVENLRGAIPVIVNSTDYSVVDVFVNETTLDVIGWPREDGVALGLALAPQAAAVVGRVYYEAPGEAQTVQMTGLSAITPPAGYQLAGDTSGIHDWETTWQMPADGKLWVAFNPGKVQRSYGEGKLAWLWVYSYVTREGTYMGLTDGEPGKYIIKEFDFKTGNVLLSVKTQVDHGDVPESDVLMQWRLIWAYKATNNDEPQPPNDGGDVQPAPTQTQTAQPDKPKAEISTDSETAKYALAGAALVLFLVLMVTLATRR